MYTLIALITRAEAKQRKINEVLAKTVSIRVNEHTTKQHDQTRAELTAAVQATEKKVTSEMAVVHEGLAFLIASAKKDPANCRRLEESDITGPPPSFPIDTITLDNTTASRDSVASPSVATRPDPDPEIARLRRENEIQAEQLRNLSKKRSPPEPEAEEDAAEEEPSRPLKKIRNGWNSLISRKK